jgi:hypothetical protein
MASITVNGQTFTVSGRDVSIVNGKVIVDGNEITGIGDQKEVVIKWEGPVANLRADRGSIEVTGNVEGNVKAGGSVTCGDVNGEVDAGGSVNCGNVGKDVDAGGSINCGNVGGDADAGGSIRMQKN